MDLGRLECLNVSTSQQSSRGSANSGRTSTFLRVETVHAGTSSLRGRTSHFRRHPKGRGRPSSRLEDQVVVALPELWVEGPQNRGVRLAARIVHLPSPWGKLPSALPLSRHLSGPACLVPSLLHPRTRSQNPQAMQRDHRRRTSSRLHQVVLFWQVYLSHLSEAGNRRSKVLFPRRTSVNESGLCSGRRQACRTRLCVRQTRGCELDSGQGSGHCRSRGRSESGQPRLKAKEKEMKDPTIKKTFCL